jgi:hypothetical protein
VLLLVRGKEKKLAAKLEGKQKRPDLDDAVDEFVTTELISQNCYGWLLLYKGTDSPEEGQQQRCNWSWRGLFWSFPPGGETFLDRR